MTRHDCGMAVLLTFCVSSRCGDLLVLGLSKGFFGDRASLPAWRARLVQPLFPPSCLPCLRMSLVRLGTVDAGSLEVIFLIADLLYADLWRGSGWSGGRGGRRRVRLAFRFFSGSRPRYLIGMVVGHIKTYNLGRFSRDLLPSPDEAWDEISPRLTWLRFVFSGGW